MRSAGSAETAAGTNSNLLPRQKRISSDGGRGGRSRSSLRPRSRRFSLVKAPMVASSVCSPQSFRSRASTVRSIARRSQRAGAVVERHAAAISIASPTEAHRHRLDARGEDGVRMPTNPGATRGRPSATWKITPAAAECNDCTMTDDKVHIEQLNKEKKSKAEWAKTHAADTMVYKPDCVKVVHRPLRGRARALAAGWPSAHVWCLLCRVPASSSSRTRCPTYATCSRRRCQCSGHRRKRRVPRTQQPSDLTSGAGHGPSPRPRSPQALSDLRSQLVQALEDVESEIEVVLPPRPRTPSSRQPASKAAVSCDARPRRRPLAAR